MQGIHWCVFIPSSMLEHDGGLQWMLLFIGRNGHIMYREVM